jgi:SAM-dependent methyltransferase
MTRCRTSRAAPKKSLARGGNNNFLITLRVDRLLACCPGQLRRPQDPKKPRGKRLVRDKTHEENGLAWDIVAQAKYEAEMEEHIELLRAGGHALLPPEVDALRPHLSGAHVVHLQCSHGLDALGLLNLGAGSVTGIDISPAMIRQAQRKASALGRSATFVCADVLNVPARFDGSADIVYTGKGALPWIMDLSAWAKVVGRLLRPGGRVFIFEGHPLDALWEREAGGLELRQNVGYFDSAPQENPGFPAEVVERQLGPKRPRLLERFWTPAEVITSLLSAGLRLELFQEHPLLFWKQFPRWPEELITRLPHSYSVLAVREVASNEAQPQRINQSRR